MSSPTMQEAATKEMADVEEVVATAGTVEPEGTAAARDRPAGEERAAVQDRPLSGACYGGAPMPPATACPTTPAARPPA